MTKRIVTYRGGWPLVLGTILGVVIVGSFGRVGAWMIAESMAFTNLVSMLALGMFGTLFLGVSVALSGFVIWAVMCHSHTIRVYPNGIVEFIAIIRRQRILASDLVSMEHNHSGDDFAPAGEVVVIRHRGGTCHVCLSHQSIGDLTTHLLDFTPSLQVVEPSPDGSTIPMLRRPCRQCGQPQLVDALTCARCRLVGRS
jgi:hypothetical protein